MALSMEGKPAAAALRARLTEKVKTLKMMNIPCGLAVLLVGDDHASIVYAEWLGKLCSNVGLPYHLAALPLKMDPILLQQIWQAHNGKILGLIIGLVVGLMIIAIGFFQALFVLFCMIVGYVIGKRIDEKEDLLEIIDRLLPPGTHR